MTMFVSLLLLTAACAEQANEPAGTSSSTTAGDTFVDELTSACDALEVKNDEVNAARSPQELGSLGHEYVEATERFVQQARQLTAPTEISDTFKEYLETLEASSLITEQQLEARRASKRERLKLSLEGARAQIETFELAEQAHLPDSCPPADEQGVYGYLFVAEANAGCFNLGTELNELGRLQARTETRAETAKMLEFMQDLGLALAAAIERAIPPELRGVPDLGRLVDLYEESAAAVGDVRSAFLSGERAAYEKALQAQQRTSQQADQIASALLLSECVNFIGLDGT
ncbi:MAG: hypothetical protein M3N53_00290 [Actinomycetota bacterium]|nr:hypothetical protein [Actinomycetota bacterium]